MAELEWEPIARGSLHPLQLQVLERAAAAPDEKLSAKQLAKDLEEPLPNMAYHVRQLAERGWLRKAGTRPARGAIQHFYRLNPKLLQ